MEQEVQKGEEEKGIKAKGDRRLTYTKGEREKKGGGGEGKRELEDNA